MEQASKKILVVMGGTSTEAEISRLTGTAVLHALQEKGLPAEGLELVPETFAETIRRERPAIVFNALHGKFGEDGLIQGTLDMMGVPYTGSGVLAAAVTMDKAATKRFLVAEGIATPPARTYRRTRETARLAAEILEGFSLPVVIKAASQGSSVGVYIVETPESLEQAIADAFSYDEELLVETFIKGKELTVAVWGDGADCEAFPVIEITTTTGRYDYESKYTKGMSAHIIPARIPQATTEAVQALARQTFAACGCKGVARVDMMLSEAGEPFVIEVNSVPGMTELSLVPDAGRAMGVAFGDLCVRLLEMAGYEQAK